jgi:uncharacterized protein
MSSMLFSVRGLFRVMVRRMWGNRPTATPASLQGKYYQRTGDCNQCGDCCQNLYLTHQRQLITSLAQFETLQALHPHDYAGFMPIAQTERGLVFECQHLLANNQCGIYEQRPGFCQSYPTEDGLLNGGKLPSQCSYTFTLLKPFTQVLTQLAQKEAH